MGSPVSRRVAVLCAAGAFLVVLAAGLLHQRAPRLAVPAERAVRIAAADPLMRAVARDATRTDVGRVDDDLVRVTFVRDGRVRGAAGVRRNGEVFEPMAAMRHQRYGTPLSHALLLIAGLTALFLLATLRRPLRPQAALDAGALAAFAIPTVLVDRGYVVAGQASAAVLLAYLAVRGVSAAAGRLPRPSGPLLLERPGAPRLGLLAAGALALATVTMTLCSTGEVDVAFATMEGATKLLHGVLPYGNLPGDIVHGDTYGLPTYAAYVPVAALWPVHTTWDDATGALVLAAAGALLVAWGLARALDGRLSPAVLVTMAFPPALITITSGTNDVLVAAALAWALAWAAHPRRSLAVLTLAGIAKVGPLALLPAWIARLRGRDRLHALAATAVAGAIVLAALLALGGPSGPLDMAEAIKFQLDRRSLSSVYTAIGIEGLQPFVLAAAAAVAVGGAALLALDDAAARDPRRLAALAVAVLALLQLAAHYWAPLYLLWLLPPAAVALLAPAAAPPPAYSRASHSWTNGSTGALRLRRSSASRVRLRA